MSIVRSIPSSSARMRRVYWITLSCALLCGPVLASAYFLQPSAALVAANLAGKPLDIAYEVRGNARENSQNYTLMASMKGSIQGKKLTDLAADLGMNLDVTY